jgi:hypothetical protein
MVPVLRYLKADSRLSFIGTVDMVPVPRYVKADSGLSFIGTVDMVPVPVPRYLKADFN